MLGQNNRMCGSMRSHFTLLVAEPHVPRCQKKPFLPLPLSLSCLAVEGAFPLSPLVSFTDVLLLALTDGEAAFGAGLGGTFVGGFGSFLTVWKGLGAGTGWLRFAATCFVLVEDAAIFATLEPTLGLEGQHW